MDQTSLDQVKLVKELNKNLDSPENRLKTILQLSSCLYKLDSQQLTENSVSWMHQCCKINIKDNEAVIVSLEALRNLFAVSANIPELNKSVCNFVSSRFFDLFLKYSSDTEAAWQCAEVCFSTYNGPCGPHKEQIEKILDDYMLNKRLTRTIARCYALLPSLGGGGKDAVNYKNNWKNQFLHIISACHLVLNELFKSIMELQEYPIDGTLNSKDNATSDDLLIQFTNYCLILQHMLLIKFPAAKSIQADEIINLICRGLAVTPATLGSNITSETIWLKENIPTIHVSLCNCLSALVAVCKTSLLPYAHVICKIIQRSLSWTQSTAVFGAEKPNATLRMAVYDLMSNWLAVTKSGGQTETISKCVVEAIIEDIHVKKTELSLAANSEGKHGKRPKAQTHFIDPMANSNLCYSALKTGQLYLNNVGEILNPEDHKSLQTTVITILSEIHRSSSFKDHVPYSAAHCRRELYSLLLSLTLNPSKDWPPPTQFALLFFNKGVTDNDVNISQTCSLALSAIRTIIHPEFSVASFPKTVDEDPRPKPVSLQWKSVEQTEKRLPEPMSVDEKESEERRADDSEGKSELVDLDGSSDPDELMSPEDSEEENEEMEVDTVPTVDLDDDSTREYQEREKEEDIAVLDQEEKTEETAKDKKTESEPEPVLVETGEDNIKMQVEGENEVEIEEADEVEVEVAEEDDEDEDEDEVEEEDEDEEEEEEVEVEEEVHSDDSEPFVDNKRIPIETKKIAPKNTLEKEATSPEIVQKLTPEKKATSPKIVQKATPEKKATPTKTVQKATPEKEPSSAETEKEQPELPKSDEKREEQSDGELSIASDASRGTRSRARSRKSVFFTEPSPTKSEKSPSSSDESVTRKVATLPSKLHSDLTDNQTASPSKRYNLRSKPTDELINLRSGAKVRHSLKPERPGTPVGGAKIDKAIPEKETEDDDLMSTFVEKLNADD